MGWIQVLVPYVPFKSPRLGKISYGIILAYYLNHDTVVSTMSSWPLVTST
jgi:hypothetical protein